MKGELNRQALGRAVDEYLSPLGKDEYVRVTNKKEDFEHLKNGTHRGSLNHATGEAEYGLSVSKSPEFSGKYAYTVKGKKIADGSDGEPVLDVKTAKIKGKLMSYSNYRDKYEKQLYEKAENMGLSKEDVKLLRVSVRVK
jgi:hypothetical protein